MESWGEVMSKKPRSICEASIYHAICRGTGRQLVFEDDGDRDKFLNLLVRNTQKRSGCIIAWCLMGNHAHVLFRMPIERLSECMRDTLASYARYFNGKYQRVGHLFQGRFTSEAVPDEEYLLTVVRYIHQNPAKAGVSKTEDYRWSSYAEYLSGNGISDTSLLLGILGGRNAFREFCAGGGADIPLLTEHGPASKFPDDLAVRLAAQLLGLDDIGDLKGLRKDMRDAGVGTLLAHGFTVRQIERITGVSRGVIQRVSKMTVRPESGERFPADVRLGYSSKS